MRLVSATQRLRHSITVRLVRLIHRLPPATGGNVALIFALALPPIAVAAVGGIQLSYVVNVRSVSQDVADSAALAGAQQMAVSPVGAADRAVSWARAQLASRASSSTFQVAATAVDNHTLKVTIDAYTPSFFGDMLPKGGFKSHAEATGQQQAMAPLCVLVDGASSDLLKVAGSSRISGSCLVHGNGDISADASASITASRVEASGAATGALISPTPLTGAPTVSDPFGALSISYACATGNDQDFGNNATATLPAGVHTGKVTIGNNSSVTLGPGDHYFCDTFAIGNNSLVTGIDVALVFDRMASYSPKPNATLSLSGRQSGGLSGFVWIVARNGSGNFNIATDSITKITGAIYAPTTTLVLSGTKPSAQASDWTVVAAKALQVTGAANLQINTNYAGSVVAVPIGVGNKASNASPVRIIR